MATADPFDADRARHIPRDMLRRVTASARGAVPPAAPAAPVAPVAPAGNIFTRPMSALELAKSAGRGALSVGRGALSLLARPAALIPTAAGVLASKLAGGDVASGADPVLFSRALGEGYARYAPTFMGGLTSSEVAAGDEFGASDIGYDRFGATAPPVRASGSSGGQTPRPSVVTGAPGFDPGGALPSNTVAAPAALPALRPWTEADLRLGATDASVARIPEPGTGAIQVNRGAVRTIDDRAALTAPTVVRAPDGSIQSYVGALMNQRQAGLTEARRLAAEKLRVEALGKGATAAHAGSQALREQFQVAAAQEHLRRNPGDFAGAAAVAAGRVLPTEKFGAMPSLTGNDVITTSKSTGESRIQTPKRAIKFSEAVASAKRHGKYVSDEQVRRDMANNPIYVLTD